MTERTGKTGGDTVSSVDPGNLFQYFFGTLPPGMALVYPCLQIRD